MKKTFILFFLILIPFIGRADTIKYTTLAPIGNFIGTSVTINDTGSDLSVYLNTIYKLGVALCTGLAVLMLVIGGVEYMGGGSWGAKDEGKKRIGAAITGLLIALGTYIILNSLDSRLLNTSLDLGKNIDVQSIPTDQSGGLTSVSGGGGVGSDYINSLQDGTRSNDGSLVFSVYATPSDFAANPNGTALTTGNNGNILSDGSIALSPDLISKYNPQPGQSVYVNGNFIGYYDDTAYISANKPAVNTIDVYDKNGSLSQDTLKTIKSGQYTITLGSIRQQQKK